MNPTPNDSDDGVLTPDELHLEGDHVDEIGDNRYVVRSDESGMAVDEFTAAIEAAGDVPAVETTRDEMLETTTDSTTGADDTVFARDASALTADALEAAAEPHGIDVTLKTDGELAHLQTTSNDVREVFSEMLTWYADQLDDDCTPAEALQVLLATTNLEA